VGFAGSSFSIALSCSFILERARAWSAAQPEASLQEKRSHDRYPIPHSVVLVHDGKEYVGETRDMSLGGMFVHMTSPLRFGAEVTLKIEIADAKYKGELPMFVRWTRGEGVGLAFRSLRARDVHALNLLFKKLL
jgi:Tfp pilus assembly protein PilZ